MINKKGVSLNEVFKNVYNKVPGVLLCLIITLSGIFVADLLGELSIYLNILPEGSVSPISGIFVAILIGILIRNTLGLHHSLEQGVKFSLKLILRAGIVLLGLRLSLIEAVKLGAWGLPLIMFCISIGLIITLYIAKKLKISRRLGALIAGGTGICGVTAIMAISPVIKAKDDEISYAVANITIFGLIGMLFYPYLAHFFFADDPIKIGLFLGTSIHDTAQVTGAALMYSEIYNMPKVIDVATVTKLTRNLFIIVIIPIISYLFYKGSQDSHSVDEVPKWYTFIPLFVIGFLLLSLLRTIGDYTLESNGSAFGLLVRGTWEKLYTFWSSFGSKYLLGIAMSGVGLSTNLKMFKGIGMKPFYIGMIAAFSVGVASFTLVSLFGDFVKI